MAGEKDSDPEESHLIPDAQVNSMVFLKKYQKLVSVEPKVVLLLEEKIYI